MKLDYFCNTLSGRAITYSYTKRGTKELYCPDDKKERMDGMASYDRTNGNLFYGYEVSWKGEILLDRSVDINIDFGSEEFIDHVDIWQCEGSKPKSIEVLTRTQGRLKKIAVYENGAFIAESQFSIPVGYSCDNIVVRLNGAYENIGIKKFNVRTAADLEKTVFPMLNQMTKKDGILPFQELAFVNCKCEEAKDAEKYLKERWKEHFGYCLETSASEAGICMSLTEREDDGFDIEVDEDGCRIHAGCKRGFVYAVDVLVQLAEENGLRMCSISEKPAFEFRGIHVGLGNRDELPFLKKFIREMAVPMRYNSVIIEVNAAMRYEKLPEINEAWLNAIDNYNKGLWPKPAHYGYVGGDIFERDEIKALCDYIRSFGLEIIPEVQCLSHAQYFTTAFPQLAERKFKTLQTGTMELYGADERPAEFYYHNMCPLHEDYYKYVFMVIDEVVEAFQPERYLHMGHDEGYDMGECEKCSKEIPGKLFADEVSKLNEYVKSKNLTMMIWSDMLQAESFRGKSYSTPEAINWMPKDVVLLDFTWYFHTEQDLEDKLLANGFKVGIGNLYSSHFPRYESRSKKPGIIGGQISMWVACKEEKYAYEGKMYDMMFTANMLWYNEYNSAFRLAYNEIIKPLLWQVKCRIGEISEEGIVTKVDFAGSMQNIPNELLWNIPYHQAAVISAEEPEMEVEVHDTADTLFIVHATDLSADRVMWKPSVQIGEYSIVYEDGTVDAAGVYYGDNICKHSQPYGEPIASVLFRHEGYTGTYSAKPICGKDYNGKDYTLLELAIKNKFSDKKICKIVFRHMQNTDARIYIYDIKRSRQERATELFEKLQIPYYEHFEEYVEEGFKLYEQLRDFAFDKGRIRRLEDTYHIFGEFLDVVLESADVIRADKDYSRLCYIIISLLKQGGPIDELKLPDKGDLATEFVGLFAILYYAQDFVKDCEKRGISQKVVEKTLRGINCIRVNKELMGYPGIRIYLSWLRLYARKEIYHINRFSFQLGRQYNGEDVISVHIPRGIDLSTEKVLQDFAEAEAFFKTHFPERRFAGLVCHSWMMNPNLAEIMGRETNVSRFGDLFERYDIESAGAGVYRFVFNLAAPVDPNTLCENTSMQKAIKKYLLEGNIFKEYGGFRKWTEE